MRDRFLWWGSVPLAIGEEIKLTPGHAAYVKWRETVFAQVTGNTELMDQVRHQLVVRIAPEWVDCIPTVTAAWEEIAEAAITAYEDPMNLGPIARDMEPDELARLNAKARDCAGDCGCIHCR